jgi:hypothetical protein
MKKTFLLSTLLVMALYASGPAMAHAQAADTTDPLFMKIQSLDTKFFDATWLLFPR